ncbi:MAG: PIG-L deacetylase family protein [Candidatus Dormibacteria bacterium]
MPESPTDTDGIQRVLIVVAHPDDCDFGCAATTARWTDAGIDVSYCIVTDGQAGGWDRSVPRDRMGPTRRAEQTAAAAAVGVREIAFLGYPDGELTVTHELRRDITRVIRQKRPDRVVTQSPERSWSRLFASHPDHLAAAEAAICAVYPDSRNPFAHSELLEREGLEPHTVRELWLMGIPERVNVWIDVTATADRKLEALRCHRSQYEEWEPLEKRVRGWLRTSADGAGLGEGAAAEGFYRVGTG